jgi:hypothetical protein
MARAHVVRLWRDEGGGEPLADAGDKEVLHAGHLLQVPRVQARRAAHDALHGVVAGAQQGVVDILDGDIEHPPQRLPHRLGLRPGGQVIGHPVAEEVVLADDEVFLRGEVPEECPFGHPGRGGNLLDRGRLVVGLNEEILGEDR